MFDNRHVAGRVSSPGLVGRTSELAELAAALDAAAAGSARLVLLGGDSGIGKSRLIAELVRRAEDDGVRVLTGECVELSEGEIPFAPVVSALRRLARQMDSDDFAAVLGPAREEMTRLFPELAPSTEDAPEILGIGSIAQSRLFELLFGVLERLGQMAPVLLVIEDLHWADRSTRDLLTFLARSLRQEQLLIVVTYRSDELHRRHPLRPFLAQIERMASVERVALAPLSRDEVIAQLEQIRGERPSAAVVDAIFERSEGNPFFTEELLAAGAGETCMPETLRDTLLLRVEGLSPAAQQILRAVAAAGRRAQHGLLAAVLGLPEADLLHGLREAVSHHVLVEAADEASYEFRHALMREAVYEDLLPGERSGLHVALAYALEADPDLAGEGTSVIAELAYHWYAAHELDHALKASIDAGLAADNMYAFAEAARHYERALEIWDRVSVETERGLDRAELIRRAADAAHHAGANDRAAALIRSLIDDLDPATHAEDLSRALERLGRYLWVGGHGEQAVDAYHDAVCVLPPTASEVRAHALAAEGQALMLDDRHDEARALCAEALPMARSLGNRRIEANILNTLIGCYTFAGETDAALQAISDARAIAREHGYVDELLRSYVNGGDALDQAGRVEEAYATALEGIDEARRLGLEKLSGHFLQAEASARLYSLGRWDEAYARAHAVTDGSDQPLPLVIARHVEAAIAIERGELERGRALLESSRDTATRQGGSQWLSPLAGPLAAAELIGGDPESARAMVAETLDRLDGEYVFFSRGLYATALRAEGDIAEHARLVGDREAELQAQTRAVALVERFDRLLDAFVQNPPPAAVAIRRLLEAELSRVRGQPDDALWDAASEGLVQETYRRPYVRFRRAEALVLAGHRADEARQALVDARAEAEQLGMAPLIAQIDALSRRARLKLPTASAEAAHDSDSFGLTNRELEVLALVAEGRTNRQIGTELFMSEKTASVHVSRILQKLSASNRAEAAASAQRLGLVRAG